MKDSVTFNLTGTLDRAVEEVERALAAANCDIVLDLRGATFITVEGLEWLEELLLRSTSLDANVHFTNIPPSIYKVFKVAHINSLLSACGSPVHAGPVC